MSVSKPGEPRDVPSSAPTPSSPFLDDSFVSFMTWSGVWMMSAPKPQRFNPHVIAEKIVLFLKGSLGSESFSRSTAEKMYDRSMLEGDIDLVSFYLDQFLPSQKEFEKIRPTKGRFEEVLAAAVETGDCLMSLHALVQFLFWQAHIVVTKYPHLDSNLAMEPNYNSFLAASRIIASRMGLTP